MTIFVGDQRSAEVLDARKHLVFQLFWLRAIDLPNTRSTDVMNVVCSIHKNKFSILKRHMNILVKAPMFSSNYRSSFTNMNINFHNIYFSIQIPKNEDSKISWHRVLFKNGCGMVNVSNSRCTILCSNAFLIKVFRMSLNRALLKTSPQKHA